MATVNKAELADVLQVSLPTLDRMIRREPDDFPIVEKGTNGREYAFDLDAVIAFLQQRRDEAASAGRERDELLRQFKLPGIEDDPATPAGLNPSQLLQLARTRQIERQEQREAGFLVETARVRQLLSAAWMRLSRAIDTSIRQALRDSNVPEPTIRQVEARIADAKRRHVEEIATFLEGDAGSPAHGLPPIP